jgi:heme O synthase-like polyprenyltransferase
MVWLALRVRRDSGLAAAKQLFGFSILYLFVLFAVLLADDRLGHLLGRSV